jgi:rhodanese-related sulfurtransferase
MHIPPCPLILILACLLGLTGIAGATSQNDMRVGITPSLKKLEGRINGKKIVIMRNQDVRHRIDPAYALTSRPCPPFCIQPIRIAPGVETIGEREVIHYLKRMIAGDKGILLVDSRTPDWVAHGTIPGAINIPWTRLTPGRGADPLSIADILAEQFGAVEDGDRWDFSHAKTLVLFCNGMWCGQSPSNIRNLLRLGYPAEKLKWYRGGMQDWEILGLSTVKP